MLLFPGQVAQSVERAAENRKVGGSIPSLPTTFALARRGGDDARVSFEPSDSGIFRGPRGPPERPRPRLRQDDHGRWLLQDRRTSEVYKSPSDLPQPRPADVGYLFRLRRPDGNGTFVLLTGIHAVGSHGIID
jgi:hypothetical protein